jgi:hypothetical protein
VLPAQQLRGGVTESAGGKREVPTLHGHLWVPIDDETTFTYNWIYSYDPAIPLDHEHAIGHEIYSGRGPEDYIPGTYRLKRNRDNDYLIDRELQRTTTYTGIKGINTQDYALQEGMGPICDRTPSIWGAATGRSSRRGNYCSKRSRRLNAAKRRRGRTRSTTARCARSTWKSRAAAVGKNSLSKN